VKVSSRMNPKALIKAAELVVRQNSPAILAGIGVAGTVVTAYLAHETGRKTGMLEVPHDEMFDPLKNRIKHHWKRYIPPVAAGVITAGCIVASVKIGNRRTAAITAAYSLSEKAFQEYRDKVTEKLGERKEQGLRDDLARDKVAGNAPGREIVLMGTGDSLCCDMRTGRYFLARMEQLKKGENDVNFRILQDGYAYLADFYAMLGVYLPKEVEYGTGMGWTKEKGAMELIITTVLADETRPCLAINYNYLQPL